jgi:hypothetical protein
MIFFSYRGCWMWSSNYGSLLQIILVVVIGGCLFAHKCFKTITHQLLLLPLLTIIAHFPTFKSSPTYPAQKFRGSSLWGQWFRLSLFALCWGVALLGRWKQLLYFLFVSLVTAWSALFRCGAAVLDRDALTDLMEFQTESIVEHSFAHVTKFLCGSGTCQSINVYTSEFVV